MSRLRVNSGTVTGSAEPPYRRDCCHALREGGSGVHDVSRIGNSARSHQTRCASVRFGLLAVEVASIVQMPNSSQAEGNEPGNNPSDAEVDAAARAIKAKLLGNRETGFRNVLQINFPDDDIRAMAEAALTAAHRAR